MSALTQSTQDKQDATATARSEQYVAERKSGQHAVLTADREAAEASRVAFEARAATRMQTAADIEKRAEFTAKLAALDAKIADAEA